MCWCMDKLQENEYVDRGSTYDNLTKDFSQTNNYTMSVKGKKNALLIHYCPICGEKIVKEEVQPSTTLTTTSLTPTGTDGDSSSPE
jgi:hypothetical protein